MDERTETSNSLPPEADDGIQPKAPGATSFDFEEWLDGIGAPPSEPAVLAQPEPDGTRSPEQSAPAQPAPDGIHIPEQPLPTQPEASAQPEQHIPTRPAAPAQAPAPTKKKTKKGLLIGLIAGAAVLAVAAAVFLLSYFSADARFDRAMKEEAFGTAEEILRSGTLKASEQNDAYYLILADRELADYRSGAVDYKTAVEYLLTLESAKLHSEETRQALESRKSTVVKGYLNEISTAYQRGQSDYESTLQALLALKAEPFLDDALRGQVETCEKDVIESHLEGIYTAFRNGELSYGDAVAQLSAGDPFGETFAAESVERYLAQLDESRQSLYVSTIWKVEEDEEVYSAEELIAALEPFAGYRNADALIGILNELIERDGVEAARQLLAYRDTVEADSDALSAETDPQLFGALKSRILHLYLDGDTSWDDYAGKLDLRLRSDYTEMLFGEPSTKYTSMFGGESSRTLTLSKNLDLNWFNVCKGGTGKVLYIAHYLNSSSGDSYDTYYYYRYENLEDLPIEYMPESLEDVEYLVLFEQGGKYYSSYRYSDGSGNVTVYLRTIQVKVIRFPSGEVIYDSGVLTGPNPPSTMNVFSGTKYAYGDDPDLSAVTAQVKALIGLS